MATEKVGIYRKYHGPVPTDKSDKSLSKSEWPKKRAFRWVVRWFGSDGKRYSKSFKTRKEAELFAEARQIKVRNGQTELPRNITIKEFAVEHETLMKGQIAHKTLCEHIRPLRYLLEIIGNLRLYKITVQHAELYVRRRSETGVSSSTINKEISTLRRIFKLAADRRGYLPEGQNCFKKIDKRKVSCKSLRYISVDEFQRLIASTSKFWWKTFLTLLYTTGLRLEEVANITWPDIDFEQSVLRVSAKRDSKSLVPWEPKDHELRHIPLCREMIELLTRWQAEAPECVPYVFLTSRRYALVMDLVKKGKWHDGKDLLNNVLRNFNVIRRRAEVSHCTIHDFRRSCLTNWMRKLPPHIVQKLAGHSSLETTMKFYVIVMAGELDSARDVSNDLLASIEIAKQPSDLKRRPTDPLLTHFGQNGPKPSNTNGQSKSQESENT